MANKAWNSWKTTPFDWWQCQLNFAVWCATAGCGVSVKDHLQATDPLLANLYRFHVYFATRRLLVELKVALPGDQSHSWYQNAYDAKAYKRLCNEFGVSSDTDWRQKLDHGCQGLRSWSTYMKPSGAYRHAHYSDGPFFHPMHAIRHNRDISGAWTMFIPDKSEGFTQAQRQYTDVCLGYPGSAGPDTLEHSQGRDGVRSSKAVPSQRRRCNCFSSDIPSSIVRYQKTLQYASTPVDFVFGLGLYLAPSDMTLHPGNVQAYNNEIVIAGSEAAIGHNPGFKESEQIGKTTGDKSFEGKIAAPAGTDH